MYFKIKALAFAILIIAPLTAMGQTLDTISFVPVKHGYYENLITKTDASFATATGIASAAGLKVNSTSLQIETGQVNFGKDISVNNKHTSSAPSIVITDAKSAVFAKEAFVKNGGRIVGKINANIGQIKLAGNKTVKAKDISMPSKNIKMPNAPLIVDGVEVAAPECPMGNSNQTGAQFLSTAGWFIKDGREAYSENLNVFGCAGTKSEKCEAPQEDKAACNRSGNMWDDTPAGCCCSGNNTVNFPSGTDTRMCKDNTNTICEGGRLVNRQAACDKYGNQSAQCICARGDKTACINAAFVGLSPAGLESKCGSNSKDWPCNCGDYQWIKNTSDVTSYVCRFGSTGAKRCVLDCPFPMVKEERYGTWQCVCLDAYIFGYNSEYERCGNTYPSSNIFKGCCCGEYYDYNSSVGGSGYKSFIARNPGDRYYAYNFHHVVMAGGTPPNPPSCPTDYRREDILMGAADSYGDLYNINGARSCVCSNNY